MQESGSFFCVSPAGFYVDKHSENPPIPSQVSSLFVQRIYPF